MSDRYKTLLGQGEMIVAMALPEIVTQDEWHTAAKALVIREKEVTQLRDELNTQRRQLPMVEVTKEYVFEGGSACARNVHGQASLLDMFQGRRQLIVDHYMFDPCWEDGCPSCAGRVDQYGNLRHLHDRDTTIAVVSRTP